MTVAPRTLDLSGAPPAPPKRKMTEEQMHAVQLFRAGGDVAVEAGAGTGKTSTLIVMARNAPKGARGQYVAFNRAIVKEAEGKMPSNVSANTAHSLAFRTKGREFKRRLDNSRRMRSEELARRVGLRDGMEIGDKILPPGKLASIARRAVLKFCQSADQELTARHFRYEDGLDEPGEWTNNRVMARQLLPWAQRIWEDAQDPFGQLPFDHAFYLKMWELDDPVIRADFILFDEAQDASPVLVSAVQKQKQAQLVWVGDSNQQIYSFTGAINALAGISAENRAMLTQSFRFGQAIADVANVVLSWLPTEMRLRGHEPIESELSDLGDDAAAVLCRTNATALAEYITSRAAGKLPWIVGDGKDQLRFAEGVLELQSYGSTEHPDLACFSSWQEVQQYVDEDAQGSDLKLLVKIVDKFGARTVYDELREMTPQDRANVVVSTAHKAKGLEWDSVRLAGDFPPPRAPKDAEEAESVNGRDEENRLLYVAVTRAQKQLDPHAVVHLSGRLSRSQ